MNLNIVTSKDYKVKKLPIGNKANNYGNYTGSMSNHDKIYQNLRRIIKSRHYNN